MKTVDEAMESLKKYIEGELKKTQTKIHPNMVRGHLRALSTEIEDGIAAFLMDILPDGYKAYVDASMRVGEKTHRPDILIIDNKNKVKALVEVKTNMGWCRNAECEIGKICDKHKEMFLKGNIPCKFSNAPQAEVCYSKDVPVYLVAFTSHNCRDISHEKNRKIADEKKVKYYCLFSGWYDDLEPREIKNFADEISNDVI